MYTTGILNILHDAHDDKTDLEIYKKVIPYFQAHNSFTATNNKRQKLDLDEDKDELPAEYVNLAPNVKKAFRQLFYGQYDMRVSNAHINNNYTSDSYLSNINVSGTYVEYKYVNTIYDDNPLNYLSKAEFLELYNFLDFICYLRDEFRSVFIRYLYMVRMNNEFMRQTAHIHKRPDFIYLDYCSKTSKEQKLLLIKMWCVIFGLDINTQEDQLRARDEFRRRWEEKKCADSLHIYATFLYHCIGLSDKTNELKDEAEARRLYKLGWEENKHLPSLFEYIYCLEDGIGGQDDEEIHEAERAEARNLFKLIGKENLREDVFQDYIFYLKNYSGIPINEMEIRRLYKLNWEKNKFLDSLHNYAQRLKVGVCEIGYLKSDEKEKAEARRLFKFLWEENKHIESLNNYASCLEHGIGGPDDIETRKKEKIEARRLYKFGWEEYNNMESLDKYISCLTWGVGGPMDRYEANRLKVIRYP